MATKIVKTRYLAKRYAIQYFRSITHNKHITAKKISSKAVDCSCGETEGEIYIVMCGKNLFDKLNKEGKAIVKVGICDKCGETI